MAAAGPHMTSFSFATAPAPVLPPDRARVFFDGAMLAVDIWCGEVKSHLQAAEDPQVKHMGMIASYEHPTAGTVKVVAPAVKLSATPAAIDRPAPLVGQQTREILREAGVDQGMILDLLQRGVLGEPASA
jgi:crotonobetainyl-CoA:carnitine CoA-transferase CaiB-like acyl-CoA transferase